MTDEAWDGLPHWEKDPEVAEKFITYLDKTVENGACRFVSKVEITKTTSADKWRN